MSAKYDFSKKYVLVTGSTQGIGKTTAIQFLKYGAKVAVNGRSKERVEKLVKELNEAKYGGKAVAAPGDVATTEGTDAIIAATDKHGDLDFLINNAAVGDLGALENTPDSEWIRMYEVNVLSAVRLSKHYLPKLLKKKEGRIINVSSIVGLTPLPDMLAYSVSKAALDGLTKALAATTAGTKVTVNSLTVGPTDTEVIDWLVGKIAAQVKQPAEAVKANFLKDRQDKGFYLGRWIQPVEVAEVMGFLASDSGVLVNGASQRADGGTMRQF